MPNHVTNILKFHGSAFDVESLRLKIGSPPHQVKSEFSEEMIDVAYRAIDFQSIIPRPESLNIISDSLVGYIDNGFLADESTHAFLARKIGDAMTGEEIYAKVRKIVLDTPAEEAADIPLYSDSIKGLRKSLGQATREELLNFARAYYNKKEYGSASWYDWSVKNWGTKWNGYDQTDMHPAQIRFDTAWSHPFPVIHELSRMFPKVKIEVLFADEDIGFNFGHYMIQDELRLDIKTPEEGSREGEIWAFRVKCYEDEEIIERIIARSERADGSFAVSQEMAEAILQKGPVVDLTPPGAEKS